MERGIITIEFGVRDQGNVVKLLISVTDLIILQVEDKVVYFLFTVLWVNNIAASRVLCAWNGISSGYLVRHFAYHYPEFVSRQVLKAFKGSHNQIYDIPVDLRRNFQNFRGYFLFVNNICSFHLRKNVLQIAAAKTAV